jgi:hypothetical protein
MQANIPAEKSKAQKWRANGIGFVFLVPRSPTVTQPFLQLATVPF